MSLDEYTNCWQAACLLLRVDDICSAKKAQMGAPSGGGEE